MKNKFPTARLLVLALLTVLLILPLASCRDAEPVGLQLPAADIGVGRDTSSVDPADSTSDADIDDTTPSTDGTDTSVPVTSPPETTPPPDTSDSADTGYATFPEDGILTICLDAGHGFDDVGTDSEYLGSLSEKDITISIVRKLKPKLEALGFTVILTHDGNTFPKSAIDNGDRLFNPKERISYSTTLNIDYFLSIHCDSYPADPSVYGTRIYYSMDTPFEKASASAANALMKGLNNAFPDAKKSIVKNMEFDSAYYVIRKSHVPSALIEIGFVTNKTDAANMLSDAWQETFADGIAKGLDQYFT